MTTATRSHLRVFHPNPSGKSASSTIVPLSPTGSVDRVTYAIRRNVRTGNQVVGGAGGVGVGGGGTEAMVDLVKGKGTTEQELLSPALVFIRK